MELLQQKFYCLRNNKGSCCRRVAVFLCYWQWYSMVSLSSKKDNLSSRYVIFFIWDKIKEGSYKKERRAYIKMERKKNKKPQYNMWQNTKYMFQTVHRCRHYSVIGSIPSLFQADRIIFVASYFKLCRTGGIIKGISGDNIIFFNINVCVEWADSLFKNSKTVWKDFCTKQDDCRFNL